MPNAASSSYSYSIHSPPKDTAPLQVNRVIFVLGEPISTPPREITPTTLSNESLGQLRQADHIVSQARDAPTPRGILKSPWGRRRRDEPHAWPILYRAPQVLAKFDLNRKLAQARAPFDNKSPERAHVRSRRTCSHAGSCRVIPRWIRVGRRPVHRDTRLHNA